MEVDAIDAMETAAMPVNSGMPTIAPNDSQDVYFHPAIRET